MLLFLTVLSLSLSFSFVVQEIMAEWNATTQTYQTPEDPTKGVESSQVSFSLSLLFSLSV